MTARRQPNERETTRLPGDEAVLTGPTYAGMLNRVVSVQIYDGLVPSGFAQVGTRVALGLSDDHVDTANAEHQRRRDETLRQLDGLPVVRPAGGWSLLLAVGLNGVTAISASAHVPGGPCIQPDQTVSLESVAGYDDVLQRLDRIERTSGGLVIVKSAGQSGEGRGRSQPRSGGFGVTFPVGGDRYGLPTWETIGVMTVATPGRWRPVGSRR